MVFFFKLSNKKPKNNITKTPKKPRFYFYTNTKVCGFYMGNFEVRLNSLEVCLDNLYIICWVTIY